MSTVTDTVDRYVGAWNETDAARRRGAIATCWSETGRYVDPIAAVEGRDGLDALIAAMQQRFPGHHLRRTGPVDAHHDRLRFAWELLTPAGTALFKGVDFVVTAPDGRLDSVTGFFDQAPGAG